MRLGTRFLTHVALAATCLAGTGLAAQGRQPLAWEHQLPLDWQAGTGPAKPDAPWTPVASSGPLRAEVTGDGTLRILDTQGIVRLQSGLPGRPLKAWRDGGVALPNPSGTWTFPVETPLAQGLGGMGWCASDFRPFLRGLLWILEDGEGFLTVVHPATARAIHLPLPPGRDLSLRFHGDRLEVSAGEVDQGAPRQWSLPWMGLLPRLAALGAAPGTLKAGSALAPFPRE